MPASMMWYALTKGKVIPNAGLTIACSTCKGRQPRMYQGATGPLCGPCFRLEVGYPALKNDRHWIGFNAKA